jgi:hypothetical protein
MSKFRNRLRYYLIGFGFGLTAIFFIFGNRACSWLPENRVKNMIGEKKIIVGDSVWDLMKCQEVNSDDIYRLLDDDGDVNFKDSKTSGYPKEYIFEGEKNNEDLSITFALYEEYSEVIDFSFVVDNCETFASNNDKFVVPIPDSYAKAIIESKEMRLMEVAKCQIKCFGISEEELLNFHKDAVVVMSRTYPQAVPNGYYTMGKKLNGAEYMVKYILGESRIRVAKVNGPFECACNNAENEL